MFCFPKEICEAKLLIAAVPTPVNSDCTPDLFPAENASRIVGRNLPRGSIVGYESTVYPGDKTHTLTTICKIVLLAIPFKSNMKWRRL